MPKDIAIKIWVRGKELFYFSHRVPGLIFEVARLSWEEAVIGKEPTSVAGRENDLVVSVVAAPILYGAVLGVIDKSKFYCLLSVNVGMETSAGSRLSVGFDAENNPHGRPNSICADYHVMCCFLAVFKRNLSSQKVDINCLNACEFLRA